MGPLAPTALVSMTAALRPEPQAVVAAAVATAPPAQSPSSQGWDACVFAGGVVGVGVATRTPDLDEDMLEQLFGGDEEGDFALVAGLLDFLGEGNVCDDA